MNTFSKEELDILSTLAYYQALGVPSLTTMELLRYWTPWQHESSVKKMPSFLQTRQVVDTLTQKGIVQEKNGYVALCGDPSFFEKRIEAKKEGIEKRRICLRFTRMLPYIPFVRMVALTGSLATDNADEQSDIDVLIASAANRIWTTRILVTGVFQLVGRRRHGAKIKNRICLNHYVALENPKAPDATFQLLPQALTTAHIYTQAIPLWGTDVFHAAKEKNPWLYSFVRLPLPTLFTASYRPSRFYLALKNLLEKRLNPFWAVVENIAGSLQTKHISAGLAGKQVDPLEVTVNNRTLLFHYPFSRSKHTLSHYNQLMESLVA